MDITEQLILHEGLKLKPYLCTAGKRTIGVGRNLDDVGVTRSEALEMLNNDITRVKSECNRFEWFKNLSDIRQRVIIDMVFNLGLTRFNGFKNLIASLQVNNFSAASDHMLDSKWSNDVGSRAIRLASWMKFNTEELA